MGVVVTPEFRYYLFARWEQFPRGGLRALSPLTYSEISKKQSLLDKFWFFIYYKVPVFPFAFKAP